MTELTRRRYPERPDCWHIYFGDVRVGTIARRVGNPFDTDPWQWDCGFYPGSHPRECTNDTAATFDQARADFERAWAVFLSKRTEADFPKWRDNRNWSGRRCLVSGGFSVAAFSAAGSRLASRAVTNLPARRHYGRTGLPLSVR